MKKYKVKTNKKNDAGYFCAPKIWNTIIFRCIRKKTLKHQNTHESKYMYTHTQRQMLLALENNTHVCIVISQHGNLVKQLSGTLPLGTCHMPLVVLGIRLSVRVADKSARSHSNGPARRRRRVHLWRAPALIVRFACFCCYCTFWHAVNMSARFLRLESTAAGSALQALKYLLLS